jgi:hypothetical protein
MSMNESPKTEQIFCNCCLIKTNHIVHHSFLKTKVTGHYRWIDDNSIESQIDWQYVYSVLECRGCETVTFRKNSYFSEYEDNEQPLSEYYPVRISRCLPNWVTDLPEDMQDLMTEVYTAFWSNNRRLATMGIRSLFDMYCEDQLGGDHGNFGVKLDLLQERKIISDEEKNIFQKTIVDFGNSATHRRFKPKYKDLEVLVQILEYLLNAYVVELRGNRLKDSVSLPPKNKPKK